MPISTIVDSLPGVGPASAACLIAALGTQRDRYSSAVELQSYSGIAPALAGNVGKTDRVQNAVLSAALRYMKSDLYASWTV